MIFPEFLSQHFKDSRTTIQDIHRYIHTIQDEIFLKIQGRYFIAKIYIHF